MASRPSWPGRASGVRGFAAMTPSGRAIVPASWALCDFANTIFSFAIASGAIGLYLVNDMVRLVPPEWLAPGGGPIEPR